MFTFNFVQIINKFKLCASSNTYSDYLEVINFPLAFDKRETPDHPMKTNTQSLIDRFSQVQVSPDVRGYVCCLYTAEWSQ